MKKKEVKIKPRALLITAPISHYETDYCKWTNEQVKFLKKGDFKKLDIENLIEEIESLGRSEKRALKSYLEVLLMHLLKCKYQPQEHSQSWDLSIKESRHKAWETLKENPSLKPKLGEIVLDAYFTARLKAAKETKLPEETFPNECSWTLKDLFPELEKKYL